MSTRIWGIILAIAGAIGAFLAVTAVLWQHQAITTFISTPAVISNLHISIHRGKSTSYKPEASYTYTFNGRDYRSDRLLPFSESGSSDWANRVVSRIRAGSRQPGPLPDPFAGIAWVDPLHPEESILVRDYSITPYIFSMITLLAGAIGIGMTAGILSRGRQAMTAIALDDSGWQLLLPAKSLRKRFTDSVWWLFGAALAILPPLAHWVFVAGRRDAAGAALGAMEGIFILILLITAARRWSVTRHVSDAARVRARPLPMNRGEPFNLEVECDAFSPLTMRELTGTLRCIEHYKEKRGNKTNYGTRTRFDQKFSLATQAAIPAGEVAAGIAELRIESPDAPPTTDISTIKSYPYYTWELRIALTLEGMVDYEGLFPLEVT